MLARHGILYGEIGFGHYDAALSPNLSLAASYRTRFVPPPRRGLAAFDKCFAEYGKSIRK